MHSWSVCWLNVWWHLQLWNIWCANEASRLSAQRCVLFSLGGLRWRVNLRFLHRMNHHQGLQHPNRRWRSKQSQRQRCFQRQSIHTSMGNLVAKGRAGCSKCCFWGWVWGISRRYSRVIEPLGMYTFGFAWQWRLGKFFGIFNLVYVSQKERLKFYMLCMF